MEFNNLVLALLFSSHNLVPENDKSNSHLGIFPIKTRSKNFDIESKTVPAEFPQMSCLFSNK